MVKCECSVFSVQCSVFSLMLAAALLDAEGAKADSRSSDYYYRGLIHVVFTA